MSPRGAVRGVAALLAVTLLAGDKCENDDSSSYGYYGSSYGYGSGYGGACWDCSNFQNGCYAYYGNAQASCYCWAACECANAGDEGCMNDNAAGAASLGMSCGVSSCF